MDIVSCALSQSLEWNSPGLTPRAALRAASTPWVKLELSFSMLLRMVSPGVWTTTPDSRTAVNWSVALDFSCGGDNSGRTNAEGKLS
ncbi:hypothetical protein IE4803_PB00141 (plasmid) [Rhizobium etli bv. phaseoli str. IE4803]|nr:hypothetical protein IE4803_PB00141 [Rhizobium etli bv. phaseoli str. IE4803]